MAKRSPWAAGIILSTLCSTSPIWAKSLEFEKLSNVGDYIQKELSIFKPEDILVIFDVDGTLTDEGEPSGKKAAPRDHSIALVKKLKVQGVQLVASSAWDDFKSVVVRVDQLGLAECFIDH